MPKMKTIKAVAKRFKVTKNKKVLKRKAGQDHFNAREAGKVTRKKRRLVNQSEADAKNIRSFLPYA